MLPFNEEYFEWLCSIIFDKEHGKQYTKVLKALHRTDFVYHVGRDSNRAKDGVELRLEFGYENKCVFTDDELNQGPCTLLEMMVALAKRIETNIMCDDDYGDRTSKWFWIMMDNLGLGRMTNRKFNEGRFEEIVDVLLYHKYTYQGVGGLFYVENPKRDMRETEIWFQMHWYLSSLN